MSRSYKKHSFDTVTGYSNKKDKKIANKSFRRLSKLCLINRELPKSIREVSNTYDFDTDGLAYYISRKDLNYLSKLGYDDSEIDNIYRKRITK